MLPREIVKKIQRIRITTNRLVDAGLGGEYHSVFRGRGMEFSEVRAYVPGDDVRAIDWNVTARTGVPHVKKFVEERDLTTLLVVDLSRSQEFGSRFLTKRALMAELAGLLAFAFGARGVVVIALERRIAELSRRARAEGRQGEDGEDEAGTHAWGLRVRSKA